MAGSLKGKAKGKPRGRHGGRPRVHPEGSREVHITVSPLEQLALRCGPTSPTARLRRAVEHALAVFCGLEQQ